MNTSNGFNSIQMFTAFLPEDFQIISQGQMKPALGRCPTCEAAAAGGPCGLQGGGAVLSSAGQCRAGQWLQRIAGSWGAVSGCAGAAPVPMNHVYCGRD